MTLPGRLGYAPSPSGWIVLAHGSTISALDARTAPAVLDRLWTAITSPQVTLESYVAAIPLFGPEAVNSFAVVVLDENGEARPDGAAAKITVVVRGEGAVEVRTPGGTRTIDARNAEPWYLAEFDSVVAFAVGANLPADAFAERRWPLASAVVQASFAAWVTDRAAEPGWDGDLEDTVLGTGDGDDHGDGDGDGDDHTDGPTTGENDAVLGETILRGQHQAQQTDADDTDAVNGETILRGTSGTSGTAGAAAPGADLEEPPDLADTVIRAGRPPVRPSAPSATPASPPTAPPVPLSPVPVPPVPAPDRALYSFRVGIGDAYPLDTPAYVGRKPSPPRIVDGVAPRLVRVGSPTQEVSSTHVEIRQQGIVVVVTDLRSTNGTVVSMPGAERVRLRQGESLVVVPGTRIEIGDGNVLEILPAR